MNLSEIRPLVLQDLSKFGISPHYEGIKERYVYPPLFNEWQLNEAPYPVHWKQTDELLLGEFSSPEYDYLIKFEPFTYQFNHKNYDCVNASFEVIVDGKPTTELTPTNHRNQVIGTIQNSLSEKLIHFDIDAILFIAVDNIRARMSLYGRMVDKFAKEFGVVYRGVKLENGEAIVILSNSIPEQSQEEIIKFTKERSEAK
jgi:hypothetical protein